MSAEVQPPPPQAEFMAFGPPAPGRHHRRGLLLLALLGAMLLAGLTAWRLWPQPPPNFTSDDLADAYAGMVRADGTNQVTPMTPGALTEPPVRVEPTTCSPLFETTVSNQFPATALDGVSTYWLREGSASISLVTYRFTDPAAATSQFAQITDALTACLPTPMQVDRRRDVSVVQQPVEPPAEVDDSVSYLLSSPPASTRISIDVARLTNTVSWQYRYDFGSPASYSPLAAQQLMTSLVSQLRSIQNARH